MFLSSHDHMAKRSYCRIMIFFYFGVLLIYGCTTTFVLFYFLQNPTTPILPVYVDQRRPHLKEDTTWPRGVIIRKNVTVPGRTLFTPD